MIGLWYTPLSLAPRDSPCPLARGGRVRPLNTPAPPRLLSLTRKRPPPPLRGEPRGVNRAARVSESIYKESLSHSL